MCETSLNGILGGWGNYIYGPSDMSSISGGCDNTIGGGHQGLAFIGGGQANTINNGAYGAILGGCGNTAAHAYAGVFGCGVTSVCGCAFHANNFVAQNIPTVGTGPAGSFYKVSCLGGWVVMVV